jgi:hypothetical protein
LYGRLPKTFLEQLFDITQGKRKAKIPAHRTKNQLRFGLPPLEDRRPGRHLALFNLPVKLNETLQHNRFIRGVVPPFRQRPLSSAIQPE